MKFSPIADDLLTGLGFILYMVSRECVYFINLRQAYLLSPYYANRLSSRTVLFTCVPHQVLDERKLRRIFGDTLKNVWIPRETDDLDQLVKEREQTAHRLEKAEILLISKANAAYRKALKNGHPDIEVKLESPPNGDAKEVSKQASKEVANEVTLSINLESPTSPREFTREDGTPILKTNYGFGGPDLDVVGSIASQWLPAEKRPYHRPIANYGRRVDTIRWTRSRLKNLAPKISKLRRQYRKGGNTPIPAAFVEFHSLVDAQSAYQTLAHHSANHMRPEIIGLRPQEIIWESLKFRWWERIIRRFLIQGFVACMVIFWSLPSILVGMISNIKYLTDKVPFLHWINLLPSEILGFISGLLPAVALSLLMALVPIIMRGLFILLFFNHY
jgi:calcium permeable stress-gated cation channel